MLKKKLCAAVLACAVPLLLGLYSVNAAGSDSYDDRYDDGYCYYDENYDNRDRDNVRDNKDRDDDDYYCWGYSGRHHHGRYYHHHGCGW